MTFTIFRHLSTINTKCGVDQKLLELFVLPIVNQYNFKPRRILILDDTSL